MAVLKRLAARTQPWRTPEEMENASEIVPFTLTTLWVDEYRVLMISTSFGGMPIVYLKNVPEGVAVQRVKCSSEVDVSGV